MYDPTRKNANTAVINILSSPLDDGPCDLDDIQAGFLLGLGVFAHASIIAYAPRDENYRSQI